MIAGFEEVKDDARRAGGAQPKPCRLAGSACYDAGASCRGPAAGRSTFCPALESTGAGDFQGVLEQVLREQEGLRFSAHARARLAQRGIPLDDGAQRRLVDAVRRAEAKGAREAVVLIDDVAYVVSVRNRTVITVVDGPRLKENVFTNIDSVVIG